MNEFDSSLLYNEWMTVACRKVSNSISVKKRKQNGTVQTHGVSLSHSEASENFQQQKEEVEALSHIFGEDFRPLNFNSQNELDWNQSETESHKGPPLIDEVSSISLTASDHEMLTWKLGPCAPAFQISIRVSFDHPLLVRIRHLSPPLYPSPSSPSSSFVSSLPFSPFAVSQLPPILLSVVLPPSYPSRSRPLFSLSCLWLTRGELKSLSQQLLATWQEQNESARVEPCAPLFDVDVSYWSFLRKWKENDGCEKRELPVYGNVVIFQWADWLAQEALNFLKIENELWIQANAEHSSLPDISGNGNDFTFDVVTGEKYEEWNSDESPSKVLGQEKDEKTSDEDLSVKDKGKRKCGEVEKVSVENSEVRSVEGSENSASMDVPGSSWVSERLIYCSLEQYDMLENKRKFELEVHTCGICFGEFSGSHFPLLSCCQSFRTPSPLSCSSTSPSPSHFSFSTSSTSSSSSSHTPSTSSSSPFPSSPSSSSKFCSSCLRSLITSHVQGTSVSQIKCPNTKCRAPLEYALIRSLLPPPLFARWEDLTLSLSLNAMEDVTYCPRCKGLCLKERQREKSREREGKGKKTGEFGSADDGREGVQVRGKGGKGRTKEGRRDSDEEKRRGGDEEREREEGKPEEHKIDDCEVEEEEEMSWSSHVQCPHCFFSFCLLCGMNWHLGTECMSLQQRLEILNASGSEMDTKRREALLLHQEGLTLALLKRDSKFCPTCGMAVTKSEGCNKMVCTHCGKAFCFRCGQKIKDYDHFQGHCPLFEDEELLAWEREMGREGGFVDVAGALMDYHFHGRGRGGERERELRGKRRTCPCCKHVTLKLFDNNHIHCGSCRQHFCGSCGKGVDKPAIHFGNVPGKCCQHSSD